MWLGKKVKYSLYIDEEIAKRGKELGLNLSKVAENAIKEATNRLEGPNGSENNEIDPVITSLGGGGPGKSRTCDPRHVKAMS
jgi:hypothetical protein